MIVLDYFVSISIGSGAAFIFKTILSILSKYTPNS